MPSFGTPERCDAAADSDDEGKVVEDDAKPVAVWGLGGDVVVAAAEILHEGMTWGEDPRGAMPLQPAHRPQPSFQPPVVCLDGVIRVTLDGVQRRGNQFVEHPRVGRGAVGGYLGRDDADTQRPGEEVPCGGQVAPRDNRTSMTWPCWSTAR